MMKRVYLIFGVLVLILGVASYFSFHVGSGNLVTGQAVNINPNIPDDIVDPPPPPALSYFVGGDVDNCFVYSADCPSDSITMFRVGTEFLDSAGGAHIAKFNNAAFAWRMCCKNILSYDRGNRKFSLFSTGITEFNPDIGEEYGSHVYPPELDDGVTGDFIKLTPEIANYIEYSEEGCSPGYECIAKVSSLDKCQGYEFCNSHIWSCDTTFPNFNLTSVCYKPEQETNCDGWQSPCDWEGYKIVGDVLLYCSFGIDDVQNPEYPNAGYEQGICCEAGLEYGIGGICWPTAECGFGISGEQYCYLPDLDVNGRPVKLYEKEYFDQTNCVKWNTQEACCWDIGRYGGFGNYFCDFSILDLD